MTSAHDGGLPAPSDPPSDPPSGASTSASRILVSGPASWNSLVGLEELPEPRPQMVRAERHWQTLGGTSAGKALNLAALGAAVVLRTVIGDDEPGARIRAALDVPGIELLAEPAAGPSEQHLNLMAGGDRLSIYLDLPEPAADVHAARTRAALAECDVAVLDLAVHNLPWLEEARRLGRPVWCDVHDHDGVSAFHRPWLRAADVLFLNDDKLPDPLPFMRAQVATGTDLVVCTQGASGATAVTTTGAVHVPADVVPRVVDTNGAGDAFMAGFLVAHLAGVGLEDCLRAGHAQAARCLAVPDLAP